MAILGSGAVLGALLVAALTGSSRKGRTVLVLQLTLGGLILGFALSPDLWLSRALLFLGGTALVAIFALISSLVQTLAAEEMRGRVMSFYMIFFRGGMPLGSLRSSLAQGLCFHRASTPFHSNRTTGVKDQAGCQRYPGSGLLTSFTHATI